jgi:hypothetical protein
VKAVADSIEVEQGLLDHYRGAGIAQQDFARTEVQVGFDSLPALRLALLLREASKLIPPEVEKLAGKRIGQPEGYFLRNAASFEMWEVASGVPH